MDIIKSCVFLDIHNSILGYPKSELWISNIQLIKGYPKIELWISKNRIMDIRKWGIKSKTAPHNGIVKLVQVLDVRLAFTRPKVLWLIYGIVKQWKHPVASFNSGPETINFFHAQLNRAFMLNPTEHEIYTAYEY